MAVQHDDWVDLQTLHERTGRSVDSWRRDVRTQKLSSRRSGVSSNSRVEVPVSEVIRLGYPAVVTGGSAPTSGAGRAVVRGGTAQPDNVVAELAALVKQVASLEDRHAADQRTIASLLRMLELSVSRLAQEQSSRSDPTDRGALP